MQVGRKDGDEEKHQAVGGIRSALCDQHTDGAENFKDTADVNQG